MRTGTIATVAAGVAAGAGAGVAHLFPPSASHYLAAAAVGAVGGGLLGGAVGAIFVGACDGPRRSQDSYWSHRSKQAAFALSMFAAPGAVLGAPAAVGLYASGAAARAAIIWAWLAFCAAVRAAQ